MSNRFPIIKKPLFVSGIVLAILGWLCGRFTIFTGPVSDSELKLIVRIGIFMMLLSVLLLIGSLFYKKQKDSQRKLARHYKILYSLYDIIMFFGIFLFFAGIIFQIVKIAWYDYGELSLLLALFLIWPWIFILVGLSIFTGGIYLRTKSKPNLLELIIVIICLLIIGFGVYQQILLQGFRGWSEGKCEAETDCFTGGCSGEVCSNEAVETPCEGYAEKFLGGLSCTCFKGECQWIKK